jgi:hypothetical protein
LARSLILLQGFVSSACDRPHFAQKAMEKLTLPGGRCCRRLYAPLE